MSFARFHDQRENWCIIGTQRTTRSINTRVSRQANNRACTNRKVTVTGAHVHLENGRLVNHRPSGRTGTILSIAASCCWRAFSLVHAPGYHGTPPLIGYTYCSRTIGKKLLSEWESFVNSRGDFNHFPWKLEKLSLEKKKYGKSYRFPLASKCSSNSNENDSRSGSIDPRRRRSPDKFSASFRIVSPWLRNPPLKPPSCFFVGFDAENSRQAWVKQKGRLRWSTDGEMGENWIVDRVAGFTECRREPASRMQPMVHRDSRLFIADALRE